VIEALFAAVRADPDDTGAWKVLADALQREALGPIVAVDPQDSAADQPSPSAHFENRTWTP
jgi:hypothetical protein